MHEGCSRSRRSPIRLVVADHEIGFRAQMASAAAAAAGSAIYSAPICQGRADAGMIGVKLCSDSSTVGNPAIEALVDHLVDAR